MSETKLSGVEMMVKTILRALGVEPAEVLAAIERFRVAVPEFAQRADARLESIDTRLAAIEGKLGIEPLQAPDLAGAGDEKRLQ